MGITKSCKPRIFRVFLRQKCGVFEKMRLYRPNYAGFGWLCVKLHNRVFLEGLDSQDHFGRLIFWCDHCEDINTVLPHMRNSDGCIQDNDLCTHTHKKNCILGLQEFCTILHLLCRHKVRRQNFLVRALFFVAKGHKVNRALPVSASNWVQSLHAKLSNRGKPELKYLILQSTNNMIKADITSIFALFFVFRKK